MDFENSTQAKSWMYDRQSLLECKTEAAVVQSLTESEKPRVRRFASGYTKKTSAGRLSSMQDSANHAESMPARMSASDQDTLVHFHAHQIQRLVGPNAIIPELQRNASVLSTAIMLFRRFYLSNSVIDFHPRNMAAAAALLAPKVDCCKRLQVRSSSTTIFWFLRLVSMCIRLYIIYGNVWDIEIFSRSP